MAQSQAKCTDDEFMSMFERYGAAKLAKLLDVTVRCVYSRRRNLEAKYDKTIKAPDDVRGTRLANDYPKRLSLAIKDGTIVVGSDAHYWPGEASTAHRGLVHIVSELQPKAVILNGDSFDGATASRHPVSGWSNPPSIREELDAVEERTDEIRAASKAELFHTIGNHDARFEARLAQQAPQFQDVKGFKLSDHLPHWRFCVGLWVNDDVVIKHRCKGGIHATHLGTQAAGRTVVTGHLHSLKVTPFCDYTGHTATSFISKVRYGVDTGTLANPYDEQFDYDEDNPKNHRSGFIVMTFQNGFLLWPEVASVVDENHIQFRGKIIKV